MVYIYYFLNKKLFPYITSLICKIQFSKMQK